MLLRTPTNSGTAATSEIQVPSRTIRNRERKTPEDRRNSPSLGQILFGKTEDKKSPVDNVEEAEGTVETEEQVAEETSAIIKEQEPKTKRIQEPTAESNLLDESYKPNNVVFLIDASTSMREEQKMDILKKAMIELWNL